MMEGEKPRIPRVSISGIDEDKKQHDLAIPSENVEGAQKRTSAVPSGSRSPLRRLSFRRAPKKKKVVLGVDNVYERVKKRISQVFFRFGKLVATHPVWFSVTPIVVSGLLSLGFLNMKRNTDSEKLFTPVDARIYSERDRMKELFPDSTGWNFDFFGLVDIPKYAVVIFRLGGEDHRTKTTYTPADVSENPKNLNIYDDASFLQIIHFVSRMQQIAVEDNGKIYHVNDLCAQVGGQCFVDGGSLIDPEFQKEVLRTNVTFPIYMKNDGLVLDLSTNLAGIQLKEVQSQKFLQTVRILKVRFFWRVDKLHQAITWNKKFLSVAKELEKNLTGGLKIAYVTSESLEVELTAGTEGDVIYFVMTMAFMVIYSVFVSTGGDVVSTRALLACGGVLAASLGILSAIGLLLMCGLELVNFVGIMPFLVLGVGVDDMFLLMSCWGESIAAKVDVPRRVGLTFSKAGIGITITTLTDFLAFLIGTSSKFIVVRYFSVYTALAMLACYIVMVTLFGACLSLHGDRVYSQKHCLTCRKVESREYYRQQNAGVCTVYCCGGSIPTRSFEDESPCEKMPRFILPAIVLHPVVKVVVLILFAGYMAWAVYGAVNLQPGMKYADLVLRSSYYYKFSAWEEGYFGQRLPIAFVVDQEINYAAEAGDNFRRLLNEAARDPMIYNRQFTHFRCWLLSYSRSVFYPKTRQDALDPVNFIEGLHKFLEVNILSRNDIHFDLNQTKILASRCYVLTRNEINIFKQSEMMVRQRKLVDSFVQFKVLVYQPIFVMLEHTLEIIPSTLSTVGVAVMVMFVVTLVMLPQLLMVSLVTLNIVLIITCVFGSMYWLNINFSGLSMIFILMSIGFSVDFSAHICAAYLMCDSPSRHERSRYALVHACGPILNGGLTSLIGVSTLLFSDAYFFQIFFMIMAMVIMAGTVNSVLFMPIVLSFIGPQSLDPNQVPETYTEQLVRRTSDDGKILPRGRRISLAARNLALKIQNLEDMGKDASFERLKMEVELAKAVQSDEESEAQHGPGDSAGSESKRLTVVKGGDSSVAK